MRTGANFARGSCRALNWMALVGMVFVLGAEQAAAQAPAIATATFEGAIVTVTLGTDEEAYRVGTDFEFTVSSVATTPTGASDPTVISRTSTTDLSTDKTTGKMEFKVTFPRMLQSAGVSAYFLHYDDKNTGPSGIWRAPGDGITEAQMVDTSTGVEMNEPDTEPRFRTSPTYSVTVGEEFTQELPEAMGGNGMLTYAIDAGTLPDDWEFDADTRELTGTPEEAKEYFLLYQVWDADDGFDLATDGADDTVRVTIDAMEEPDDPFPGVAGTAIITEITIDGARKQAGRLHVDEGTTTDLEVTVRWTNDDLRKIYLEDSSPDPVKIPISAMAGEGASDWLSPAEITGVGEDVDRDQGTISITIPTKPSATASKNAHVTKTGMAEIVLHDDEDAEDEEFYIMVGTGTMGVNRDRSDLKSASIVIEDDEMQGFKLTKKSGVAYEGGSDIEFELEADPELVNLTLDVRLSVTEDGDPVLSRIYPVSPLRGTISAGEDKLKVTIDPAGNDGDRIDNDLMLHAEAITGRDDVESTSEDFEVKDVHKLPYLEVSPKTHMLQEGEEVELTLTLDRNRENTRAVSSETRQYTSEAVDVSLMDPSGAVKVMTVPVKFPEHNKKAPWTQTMKVKVMAEPNDDLDGERMVMLNAEVAGTKADYGMAKDEYPGVTTLTVEEGTEALVWAKTPEEVEAAVMAAKKAGMGDDMTFTAGEMIELEGNDLFGSAQGVTVGYTAMVEGDAVSESVSGGMVTITADSMGMAKVTITARASRPSGAVMINDQTDPREASITIALEVGLVALSIELTGPEDKHLVEGGMAASNGTAGSAMVTAKANRPVTEDVTIMLMADRSMSDADASDFMAEAIVIEADTMVGTTMVTAVDDDMMEDGGEQLVLFGMTENNDSVTGNVTLHLWDAAVPALPIIAQLLLAALMAVGGYRRYRRR